MTKCIFALLLLLSIFSSFAKAEPRVIVATVDRPPFAFTNEQKLLTGFSVELWEKLAQNLNLRFEWQQYQQFSEMIDALKNKQVDLAISNISITATREDFADFSHPIFASGMSIAVKKGAERSYVSIIWESGIILFLGGALILLLIIAHIVWFFERNSSSARHDYFRDDYFGGVWDAFWWAFIIMTMGGFENEVPNKIFNRMIAMFWIVASLFFISTLTAKITTALTVAELKTGIESFRDLNGKRVGVTEGSSHQKFMRKQNIPTISYLTLDEMYADLKDNSLDAVVGDYPILSYYSRNQGSGWLQLAGDVFNQENYGIVFPENSKYVELVNKALLEFKEQGEYAKLYAKYFGNTEK